MSNLWRRGQNIQGAMPKNILGTARMVSSALKWVYFAKRVLKKFHVEQNTKGRLAAAFCVLSGECVFWRSNVLLFYITVGADANTPEQYRKINRRNLPPF